LDTQKQYRVHGHTEDISFKLAMSAMIIKSDIASAGNYLYNVFMTSKTYVKLLDDIQWPG